MVPFAAAFLPKYRTYPAGPAATGRYFLRDRYWLLLRRKNVVGHMQQPEPPAGSL